MGRTILYTGPMFAGKTTNLIKRAVEYDNFDLYKPNMDDRYSKDDIVCHNGEKLPAASVPVDKLYDEVKQSYYEELDVVGVDEAQFFGDEIVEVYNYLEDKDVDMIFAGLDLDFKREQFGRVLNIAEKADEVFYLTADCDYEDCDKNAEFTQRLIDGEPASYDSPQVVVGKDDVYEARCEGHHVVRNSSELYKDLVSE